MRSLIKFFRGIRSRFCWNKVRDVAEREEIALTDGLVAVVDIGFSSRAGFDDDPIFDHFSHAFTL